jgi:penicillin V acylase-like amidase (Ntn superfamily)
LLCVCRAGNRRREVSAGHSPLGRPLRQGELEPWRRPKEKDPRLAVATVFSLIRSSRCRWASPIRTGRTSRRRSGERFSDAGARRYFFESSFSPTIFWVDLDKLNLAPGATPAKLELEDRPIIAGEASAKFTPAEPFKFLSH